MRLILLTLLCLPLTTFAQATKPGTYYVKAPTVHQRLGASDKAISTNKIYAGQKVEVLEIKGRWARVSKYYDGEVEGLSGQVARWVPADALSSTKPAPTPQKPQKTDSRIAKDAIPKAGEGGLTQTDVDILYRGAQKMLDSGRCNRIEYGDKSTSKPNTYYVNCGGPQNLFFTPNDL